MIAVRMLVYPRKVYVICGKGRLGGDGSGLSRLVARVWRRLGWFFSGFLMFLALAPFVAGAGETHTLTVVCSNGRPGVGQAALALFSSEEDFLKEPVAARTRSLDQSGEAVFALEGLAPGDYAVSVFYDEDGDGKLDTNFLGIPKELVGFSNNAKGRFGPPSFEQCKFELKDDKVIEIRLGKAKR